MFAFTWLVAGFDDRQLRTRRFGEQRLFCVSCLVGSFR